jgi:mercuric ion transport protein
VLPLVLAALGIGATGLGVIVPFHWPLTILAALAVTAGWLLYARKRRACASDAPPSRGPFAILCAATLLLIISAIWSFIEMPLMKILAE